MTGRTGLLVMLVVLAGSAQADGKPPPAQDAPATGAQETVEYGRLGPVAIYRPRGVPQQVVLFVSGDGGWGLGVVQMAQHLAERGALVAGIDINQYGKRLLAGSDRCLYPPGDLEGFAHFLEARENFPKYVNPILVGYSSGATLVYTTLVQSPAGTFKGGLSLGFCPDLPWQKPMCPGSGAVLKAEPGRKQGYVFQPAPTLKDRWIVMQGSIDQVCAPEATGRFVGEIPAAELIMLEKVGHGYSVERNYLPQYLAAYDRLAAVAGPVTKTLAPGVADLPLVEVPASSGRGDGPRDVVAILLTGDGGWAGLDRDVAGALSDHGIPVIGWDSLRYYWKPRTPEVAAQDLDRIIRHYTDSLARDRVLLVGYSMGADVIPFLLNRLPAGTRAKVASAALLGLGTEAIFEFHVGQWVGAGGRGLAIEPEVRRLAGSHVSCIYGRDDEDSLCRHLPEGVATRHELGGGHHFGGDYEKVAQVILAGLAPRAAD